MFGVGHPASSLGLWRLRSLRPLTTTSEASHGFIPRQRYLAAPPPTRLRSRAAAIPPVAALASSSDNAVRDGLQPEQGALSAPLEYRAARPSRCRFFVTGSFYCAISLAKLFLSTYRTTKSACSPR